MHFDLVSYINAHQIFPDLDWAGIGLASVCEQVTGIRRDDVRVDRQFRLDLCENCRGFFRFSMVVHYFLHLPFCQRCVQRPVGICSQYLMDQNVRAPRKLNQIFRVARVSGKHDRVPGIVDSISQRGLDCAVIDCESCNFHSAALVNNALFNILCFDDDPWRRYLLIDIASDVNVERIGLLQMFHHLPRPAGSPNPQRSFSPYDPTRQPQIGHSHDVVGTLGRPISGQPSSRISEATGMMKKK